MKLSTKILLSIIVISLCTLMGFGIYACDQSNLMVVIMGIVIVY